MKKENKNIEVVKREYHIFRFFRIRKEAKRAMEEINKEGFGYVKPELLNILYKKRIFDFPILRREWFVFCMYGRLF